MLKLLEKIQILEKDKEAYTRIIAKIKSSPRYSSFDESSLDTLVTAYCQINGIYPANKKKLTGDEVTEWLDEYDDFGELLFDLVDQLPDNKLPPLPWNKVADIFKNDKPFVDACFKYARKIGYIDSQDIERSFGHSDDFDHKVDFRELCQILFLDTNLETIKGTEDNRFNPELYRVTVKNIEHTYFNEPLEKFEEDFEGEVDSTEATDTRDRDEVLADLIIDEKEAIEGYQEAIDTLTENGEISKTAKETLQHINDEELEHIQELSELVGEKHIQSRHSVTPNESLNESSQGVVIGTYTDPKKENYQDIEYAESPKYDRGVTVIGGQTVDVKIYPYNIEKGELGHSFYYGLKTTDGGYKNHMPYIYELKKYLADGSIKLNAEWESIDRFPYLRKKGSKVESLRESRTNNHIITDDCFYDTVDLVQDELLDNFEIERLDAEGFITEDGEIILPEGTVFDVVGESGGPSGFIYLKLAESGIELPWNKTIIQDLENSSDYRYNHHFDRRVRESIEEDGEEIEAEVEPAPVPVTDTSENTNPEIVKNALIGCINGLMKQSWDLIDNLNGAIATIDYELSDDIKDQVEVILNELVDDTTIHIGMLGKISGMLDAKTTELLDKGEEKAETLIADN